MEIQDAEDVGELVVSSAPTLYTLYILQGVRQRNITSKANTMGIVGGYDPGGPSPVAQTSLTVPAAQLEKLAAKYGVTPQNVTNLLLNVAGSVGTDIVTVANWLIGL